MSTTSYRSLLWEGFDDDDVIVAIIYHSRFLTICEDDFS